MSDHTQETVIAQGVTVEGNFVSQGSVSIDGDLTGSVSTAGELRVGASANIKASIIAKSAEIAGKVEGNIEVNDSLDLASTAFVLGDIKASVISIASGARINGHVRMGELSSSDEK